MCGLAKGGRPASTASVSPCPGPSRAWWSKTAPPATAGPATRLGLWRAARPTATLSPTIASCKGGRHGIATFSRGRNGRAGPGSRGHARPRDGGSRPAVRTGHATSPVAASGLAVGRAARTARPAVPLATAGPTPSRPTAVSPPGATGRHGRGSRPVVRPASPRRVPFRAAWGRGRVPPTRTPVSYRRIFCPGKRPLLLVSYPDKLCKIRL